MRRQRWQTLGGVLSSASPTTSLTPPACWRQALEEKDARWHTQGPGTAPPRKLDPEAVKPAGGHGALSTEAARERLEHKYAPGRRTWFFWTVIALAANGGLLLGARLPSEPLPWLLRKTASSDCGGKAASVGSLPL